MTKFYEPPYLDLCCLQLQILSLLLLCAKAVLTHLQETVLMRVVFMAQPYPDSVKMVHFIIEGGRGEGVERRGMICVRCWS